MCGIFGYVGKNKNAAQNVLDGLKTLEYRGYDSWGIAMRQITDNEKQKTHFVLEKHVGKIGKSVLSHKLSVTSNLAIGHTRWATHGGVTETNAHPHLDCTKQLALVHNGIVENFNELKAALIKKKHTFISETDTEVIVHLIEEELMKPSDSSLERSASKSTIDQSLRQPSLPAGRAQAKKGFATAVRDAFNQLEGMNAIVVAYAPSKEIVVAKTGSPLAIGIGDDEYIIASDASGIVKHTKKVIFLADNQMAILGESLKLLQLPTGKEIKPQIDTLDWEFENTLIGKYPHFTIKEIHEQPQVIKNIALTYGQQTKKLAELIQKAFGTFMVACGTAANTALAGTYLFSSIAKKHVNFSIGSEFEYLEDYLTNKTLLIPISQSGETIDVIEPVTKAKKKGVTIAALVNVQGSTLFRLADYKIILGAGQEKSVLATKSFMAMIATLILTAYTLVNKQDEAKKLLLAAAENVSSLLEKKSVAQIKKIAEKIKHVEHMYILGRGLSYATALEAALKIKESSFVHAEGFAGGELKHGVMALIEKGTPCIIYAPNDETYQAIISNAQEVKARGALVIGIGPKNNPVFDEFIQTADCREATIIPQVLVAQLFAYYLALARGIKDPDKPRNLAKSVTVK